MGHAVLWAGCIQNLSTMGNRLRPDMVAPSQPRSCRNVGFWISTLRGYLQLDSYINVSCVGCPEWFSRRTHSGHPGWCILNYTSPNDWSTYLSTMWCTSPWGQLHHYPCLLLLSIYDYLTHGPHNWTMMDLLQCCTGSWSNYLCSIP